MLTAVEFNWIAIGLAIVVSMGWGAIVYARPIGGAWWMKQVGLDPNKVDQKAAMTSLGFALALSIIMAVCFAIVFAWSGAEGIVEGAAMGILVGIGFGLPIGMVHPIFEGRPLGVGILYGAHHIVEYLLIGMLFGVIY